MSLAYVNIPIGCDLDFISSKAGVEFDGQHPKAGHTRVFFADPDDTKFDLVTNLVVNYETAYVEKRLPERIGEVTRLRDSKIKSFVFGGMAIELDLETKANLAGAVSGLDRNPQVLGLDWSLGDGEFVWLDRDTLYDLADAAFLHVQSCFTRAKELVAELKSVTTLTELDAVDITHGWPQDS